MPGRLERMVASMTPKISKEEINRKPRGRPMDSVSMLCFMAVFVSPSPLRKLPRLMFPRTQNRLLMTYNVRKNGAWVYRCPKRVLMRGAESAMMAMVAGIMSIEVYLMEDAKTVLSSSRSFFGSSFANAGNKTVDIGIVTNVRSTEKLTAAW